MDIALKKVTFQDNHGKKNPFDCFRPVSFKLHRTFASRLSQTFQLELEFQASSKHFSGSMLASQWRQNSTLRSRVNFNREFSIKQTELVQPRLKTSERLCRDCFHDFWNAVPKCRPACGKPGEKVIPDDIFGKHRERNTMTLSLAIQNIKVTVSWCSDNKISLPSSYCTWWIAYA